MARLCAAFCAALLAFGLSFSAVAQQVVLSSRDGKTAVEGKLLGYDGLFYRVETVYGELTVDGTAVSCAGDGCPDPQFFVANITISGSRTLGETLMPALLRGFALRAGFQSKRHVVDDTHFRFDLTTPDGTQDVAKVTFRLTNSDDGFADLIAGKADLALSLREVRREEIKQAKDAGLGDLGAPGRSRVIALDGLVPIVAPANTVRDISAEGVAKIFAGKVLNWSALGGVDAPISLHLRDETSGVTQAFEDRVLREVGLRPAGEITRHPSNAALADAVASDPFAIGITNFSEIGNAEPVHMRGRCGFLVPATRMSLKSEDYPFSAPLFLYAPARRQPQLVRDFLRYLRTPSAQVVIRRMGFVDQSPVEIGIAEQGERISNAILAGGSEVSLLELQAMMRRLSGLKRLTTTFRFRGGSAELDPQSRSNASQLAQSLEAGLYDDRELIFIGFSDGVGTAALNKKLARERARAVRTAVLTAAATADQSRIKISVDAFGEALPMACDDSVWGRQTNRRVEVWVR